MRSPAQSGITLLTACGRKAKVKVKVKGGLDRIDRILKVKSNGKTKNQNLF